MSLDNLLLMTDSYKVSHHQQYPSGTTHVYSYFESRGGKFPKVVFYGLQYILKKYLVGQVVTKQKIEEASAFYQQHFGADVFNKDGWMYIVEKHGGMLPLEIKAVPEGSVVATKNVLLTVENTDPACFWLTNYLETLLVQVWYPMTVATNSYYQKEIIGRYLQETADNLDGLPFKLHDFGFRGVSSVESAGIGGSAHLVNFLGSDTLMGITFARMYYSCPMAGFSIPAAEHSTITTWGKAGELSAFKNMLESFPSGLVAVVSDSYDIWRACEQYWGSELKPLVQKRGASGGTLVVRPDSGNPPDVVVKCLSILERAFGSTTNSKGYKLLPSCIRLIQGDGVSYESLTTILEKMKENKWSADNVTFGSGGALLQRLDRDTQKCAYKCSHVTIGDQSRDVFKDPITDTGKKSKRGRLTLEKRGSTHVTMEEGRGDPKLDILEPVFLNGKLLRDFSFEEIRQRAQIDFTKRT